MKITTAVITKPYDQMTDEELREDFFKEARKIKGDLLKEIETAKALVERMEAECANKFSDKYIKMGKAWPKKLDKLRDTTTEITTEAEAVKSGAVFKPKCRFRNFIVDATAECFEWQKVKKDLKRSLGPHA